MNVNFWDRIFEKFIVTEEAPLPYMLLIVYYSLDTLFVWEHTRHSNKSLYITRYVPLWKCTIEQYFLNQTYCVAEGLWTLILSTKKKNTKKKKKNTKKKRKKKKKKMCWEKERPRQIRAQQKEIDISYQRKTNSNAKKNNFWKCFLDIDLRSQNCNLKDLMCDRCLWIVMSC